MVNDSVVFLDVFLFFGIIRLLFDIALEAFDAF